MRIIDLLSKDSIALNVKISNKQQAIDTLVDLMDKSGNLNDKQVYKEAVLKREELSSTGIGDGIAIPHGKTEAVKRAGLSSMVVKDGVDYDSLDGEVSKLFFMIAAPTEADNLHLEVLARLSTMLMDEDFKKQLMDASSPEEYLQMIDKKEKQKFQDEENKNSINDGYEILAVTACPTGIAHTYMAQESLEKKAREMGITIKVETNGSGGVKNQLTKEEIQKAKCIIVAADKKVEMDRFDGKKVIMTKVSSGIHKAEELISKAINSDAHVYHAKGNTDEITSASEEKESVGRIIYKHLMNGVSHMLPFVIGGGILIALAFLFDDYSIDPSNFGTNTELAAFFKNAGGAAFNFMLPVLAGFIAMSIGDRPALAVGFVGGAIASSGGSGFLGALIAGFAAGYIVIGLKKLFSKLPNALDGLKPVLLYPFFGILLMAIAMVFVINPPVAFVNNLLFDTLNAMSGSSRVILGIIVGGMMAVDMGGPVNKAAYVFGTASIASGNYEIMAAVMAGGMVPPLAIALCTTLFKNRFTDSERKSGITNYIMGLSFITEGAIPFASADPIRVIPACVLGSGVAGALSMLFNCTLRAPHGGIFVVGVVGNPIYYLLAIFAGAIVGMLALAALKKPINK